MRIFIGLVTPDEALRRQYGLGKDRVTPRDSISHGYFKNRRPSIILAAYAPDGAPSADGLEKLLLSKVTTTDTCLLLIDNEWEHLAMNVRNACFSIVFQRNEVFNNYQNFFHRMVGKLLRSFGIVAGKFENLNDRNLLSLPLRNFDAGELREIIRICRDNGRQPTFNNDFQTQFGLLSNRRRPRRQTAYKTIYVVDDRFRFFKYGNETHARFATGVPHKPYCELAGHFRFGTRIDALRHYNVSETEGDNTSISGEFFDCHSDQHTVTGRTHLNMFSNDYF